MKVWQYLVGGLVVIGIAVQLVPNELPPVIEDNPGDLVSAGLAGEEIAGILKTSCYDCHSNQTVYPWYSYVAPFSWLVAKDTREGREELNFSTWADYEMMDQLAKLDDIYAEIEEEKMPMPIYTLVHTDAKLDAAQRQKIMEWAETTMDVIAESEEE